MNDYDHPERVTLSGGYVCRLSRAENNAWNEFCLQREEYRALLRAKSRLAQAIVDQQGSGATGHETDAVTDAELAMYYVGRDWAVENAGADAKACRERTPEEIAEAFNATPLGKAQAILDDLEEEAAADKAADEIEAGS